VLTLDGGRLVGDEMIEGNAPPAPPVLDFESERAAAGPSPGEAAGEAAGEAGSEAAGATDTAKVEPAGAGESA
jgi:hypothetical protein